MISTTRIPGHDPVTHGAAEGHRSAPGCTALGVDFSSASLGAAAWATQHVAPRAEAVAVHVAPLPDRCPYEEIDHAAREHAVRLTIPAVRGGLDGFAATLRAEATGAIVRVGVPSRELARAATELDAGLVVLGRSKQAAWDSGHETDMVCRVARQATCDTLVVPEGNVARPEHVVAAVDDGPDATRVAERARAIATQLDVPLTLLHVVPSGSLAPQRLPLVAPGARPVGATGTVAPGSGALRVHVMARRWLGELLADGDGDALAVMGEPGREILRNAARLGAGLLVLGKRGADCAPHGSLGSVARHVLTRSPCPVLAVECA
ncbi:MAG: universal stress protein [Gemmatimonadaceae bacterium]|nr:universal stress protein [Gemmatimonadaceae bacterium]